MARSRVTASPQWAATWGRRQDLLGWALLLQWKPTLQTWKIPFLNMLTVQWGQYSKQTECHSRRERGLCRIQGPTPQPTRKGYMRGAWTFFIWTGRKGYTKGHYQHYWLLTLVSSSPQNNSMTWWWWWWWEWWWLQWWWWLDIFIKVI